VLQRRDQLAHGALPLLRVIVADAVERGVHLLDDVRDHAVGVRGHVSVSHLIEILLGGRVG
jgi:hypothetical protein